jgi:hypothetical protein
MPTKWLQKRHNGSKNDTGMGFKGAWRGRGGIQLLLGDHDLTLDGVEGRGLGVAGWGLRVEGWGFRVES